jgi:hypothetical protein
MLCLPKRKNRTVLCVWTFREKFRRPRIPFEGSETQLGTDLMTSLFKNSYKFNLLSSHHRTFQSASTSGTVAVRGIRSQGNKCIYYRGKKHGLEIILSHHIGWIAEQVGIGVKLYTYICAVLSLNLGQVSS